MLCTGIRVDVPEALIIDFASDPLSANDKVLKKLNDTSWPLHSQLSELLNGLPPEAVEAAYADNIFVRIYGRNEPLARVWFTQELLIEEASRARLKRLSEPLANAYTMPYSAGCFRGIPVDGECMVRLADFEYTGSTLVKNGFSFTVCPTNAAPNSTYWLLRSFYEQGVASHVSVRLDPFLWGPSDSFPQMMYKMIVYAKPVNWDGISQLKEQHHGQMRADKPWDRSELTEFCWDPRDNGIHSTCEELPQREHIGFEGARYLHAIYEPGSQLITHFDGALRIYTPEELEERHEEHLRKSGKAGLRRKIFRIHGPVDREVFSLIAQAFFVWNDDLAKYFRETLALGQAQRGPVL